MRRDQFEIGLEREYALHAWTDDGTLAYLLANDRLLATFDAHVEADVERARRWQRMRADGWRLAPEYSRCLVEISSPPQPRSGWLGLLAGFALLEGWLARAAELLGERSRFERIACTAEYSLRTDRFVSWDGACVTELAELLLDPADENRLLGSPDDVPSCLVGSAAELGYAGFTSTNATVHPPMPGAAEGDLAEHAERLAGYFWRVLSAARQIDASVPQRHELLRAGRFPVAPDPDRTVRDALIRWGEPGTARLLDTLSPAIASGEAVSRFRELFGQSPSSSFTAVDFHAYSCRPRVVENTMLFELRCFHSGLPLTCLAPLLDAAATLPTR